MIIKNAGLIVILIGETYRQTVKRAVAVAGTALKELTSN
jgi:hypothetical protein